MSPTLRTLAIHIEPLDGETIAGYTNRLAHTHLVEEADIRRLVLEHIERARWPTTPSSRIIDVIENLAGLPAGCLHPDFDRHGMKVRCGHHSWRPEKCQKCRRFAKPRTACTLCSQGLATTTVARGGPMCLTHRSWTFRALHADVSDLPGYVRAEQMLRTLLWGRGVAPHTGEINLAAAFVKTWNAGTSAVHPIAARAKTLNIETVAGRNGCGNSSNNPALPPSATS